MKYLLILLAVAYVLFPYDLMPDFLFGLGWLDDIGVLAAIWYWFFSGRQRAGKAERQERVDSRRGKETGGEPPTGAAHPGDSDPFTALDLPRNASPEQIRKRYRELAALYHPDKVAHLGREFQELAENKFKSIQEAYRNLTGK